MYNKYSEGFSKILRYAKDEAINNRNSFVRPEHLLLAIVRDDDNRACDILLALRVDTEKLRKDIRFFIVSEEGYSVSHDKIALSIDADRIVRLSDLESKLLKDNVTEIEHLVLAILKDKNNVAANALEMNGVTYNSFLEYCKKESSTANMSADFRDDYTGSELEFSDGDSKLEEETFGKKDGNSSNREGNKTPALNKFGVDITQAAREKKLDPVIGRESEIERLAQILCRRKKNNPILIGESGVGKTAVVEGLALRIVEKKVSSLLVDKRVVMLNMTNVVAGTKYRGQFEERINTIINELKSNPDIILFIDEIHTIVGAGATGDSMDAANILKPSLARGDFQCIGATTIDEYRKKIEKDSALERRFQKVIVEPTTVEDTIKILHNIKDRYEDHHNVKYTDEAIKQCVLLSERYLSDRYFPDKAIDVLDEAGSRCRLNCFLPSEELISAEKELSDVTKLMSEAIKKQQFEVAAEYRDKEKSLNAEIERINKELLAKSKENRVTIDADDISNTVSVISGIQVSRITESENIKLANMQAEIAKKVIGQDDAIKKVVKSILRSRVGLKDPNKPIGTFLFLGPTGVGKTHLTKELAKNMFGSHDAMIRIDMSEYMEKFTVSRLVGAPPGYVGYEEGGQLTEKIRRKPYSIILLDEIEKAHTDVFNILLQLMDEGRLTDSYGKTVDCKNTIVIMTSNVGSKQLKEFGKGIGFSSADIDVENKDFTQSIIDKALNKTFSPEFLNRIDNIITFNQLTKEDIKNIINIELSKLYSKVEKIGYTIEISDEVLSFIADKGYDVQYGARPIKRAIQKYLEEEISEKIIENESEKRKIVVSQDKEKDKLIINIE